MRLLLVLAAVGVGTRLHAAPPNVIVVLTDDQGYGDISAHGNPLLKTPHLDRLRSQSVRLTDFHVCPMCTPTRGQLLTGLDAVRNRAASVSAGRTLVRPGVPFMSEAFKAAGYRTGLFGKWHLGESYPNRPNDKGFDETVSLRGWGVSSAPDHWNNDYFDGTWLHNDTPKKYPGYCTDVFFQEAMSWMGERAGQGEPFFCYISTNAPHGPLWAKPEDAKPYLDAKAPPQLANFFGMIANIDANVGKLLEFLDEKKLSGNTIVVFFHDNGGTAGVRFFNAGMRAGKTTYYEGGHRAACFLRVPGLAQRDEPTLSQVQDLYPTLAELCGVKVPAGALPLDGRSLAGVLKGTDAGFPADRKLVVQYGESPGGSKLEKHNACVCWNGGGKRWRLVHGAELYELNGDPGQTDDLAAKRPEIVKAMRDHYEAWWAGAAPGADEYVPIVLGADQQPEVALTSSDWAGSYADNVTRDVRPGRAANGPWHVKIEKAGEYEVRLRRWPVEADAAMNVGIPPFKARVGQLPPGTALSVARARLTIGDFDKTVDVPAGAKEATFTLTLPATAHTKMQTYLLDATGAELCGAYYAYVRRR